MALTDGNAEIKTSYAYEPYGNATASGEVNANAAQYTGRENDGKGLYYYRARYCHPGFSRFVAEDPIGLAGGPNVYAYVGGNPIQFTDPLGEAEVITGFTRHGLNQTINRGVSPGAMCDAVNNPIDVTQQSDGRTKYTGAGAVVVLNSAGRVITVWGK